MRKLWFAQMAKALIVFPGGFGTMDELWEMLTLLQTNKLSSHHLILIYGRKYWNKVLNLASHGAHRYDQRARSQTAAIRRLRR